MYVQLVLGLLTKNIDMHLHSMTCNENKKQGFFYEWKRNQKPVTKNATPRPSVRMDLQPSEALWFSYMDSDQLAE